MADSRDSQLCSGSSSVDKAASLCRLAPSSLGFCLESVRNQRTAPCSEWSEAVSLAQSGAMTGVVRMSSDYWNPLEASLLLLAM